MILFENLLESLPVEALEGRKLASDLSFGDDGGPTATCFSDHVMLDGK